MQGPGNKVLLFLVSLSLLLFGTAGACWGSSLEKGPVKKLEPGINYYTFQLVNWQGDPVHGHVVEVNPREVLVEVRLAIGGDRPGGMEYVSSMARRHGAVAAVNGGFFDPSSGNPVGSLVVDKKVLVSSDILRTSVGLTGEGNLKLGYFDPSNHTGEWNGLNHLVTGGPLLVADGVPVFNAMVEGFKGSILAPAARTALGETAAGNLLLVVAGGNKVESNGLTFEELAWLMAELGAEKAAALDGGSSSVMWVDGKVVNSPAGGSERKVANALLVLRQVPVYLNGNRLFFDVPPLVEDGRTLVPLRKIFEALGARVDWVAETNTVDASLGEREIQLTVGNKTALVNGSEVALDAPARVMDGRTLVPLRFVGENLGATVHWQDAPPAIFINNSGGGVK